MNPFERSPHDSSYPYPLILLILPGLTQADSLIGSYATELGPKDFYNSSGTRLRDAAAIFQQDRANFHRFGVREWADESDAFFGNRAMRAQIPDLFRRGPNSDIARIVEDWTPPNAEHGEADFVVYICGSGNQPTYLVVNWSNGDGRNDC